MKKQNLLIGISGSMSVLSLPPYLSALRAEFSSIKIIMTRSATEFIPSSSFSMFSDGIYTNEFPVSEKNLTHVELARWADIFFILPATAHLLFQVANGAADNLLSATIMAYKGEVILFPNMNKAMWDKAAVQRNVRQIEADGGRVVSPIEQMGFEYASREIRPNLLIPSVDSVLSLIKTELEVMA